MPSITLINPNRMTPPIAPIALDYLAPATRAAGIQTDILDLALVDQPDDILAQYFAGHTPDLVGVTFRNFDDCFWASSTSFFGQFNGLVQTVRTLTDAPIILGGTGFALFPQRILTATHVEFGCLDHGPQTLIKLAQQLTCDRPQFQDIPSLIWKNGDTLTTNPGRAPDNNTLSLPTARDAIDNAAYFQKGGQLGFKTKQGCPRNCLYCPEPRIKGCTPRLRPPADVADEIENLLKQDTDVFHTCDCEFNLPRQHALEYLH